MNESTHDGRRNDKVMEHWMNEGRMGQIAKWRKRRKPGENKVEDETKPKKKNILV